MPNPARTAPPPLHPAEVIERVIRDIEKFPALLPVVQKGLAVVEDINGSSSQLQRILQSDSVMVARILRLANSAYFGVMAEVRTVSMAVNIIGYRKLRSLLRHILISGLVELLSQRRPGTTGIRETALAASAAAHELAQHCQLEDPEELLVAGQLFNIGELALFWSFPKEYETVLAKSRSQPLNRAQESVFGVNSLHVGRIVLEAWRFPAVFCQITARWPDPLSESADPVLRRYLAIVHVAVALAVAMISHAQVDSLEISAEILEVLQLSEATPRQVLATLPEKVAAVRAMLAD
jgi:HD-like signal output (HDOD) protein